MIIVLIKLLEVLRVRVAAKGTGEVDWLSKFNLSLLIRGMGIINSIYPTGLP